MFDSGVYSARRALLARAVGSGLIILPGNDEVGMNYRANPYPFRQDGSFAYFCGLDIPGLVLAIDCDSGVTNLFGPEHGLLHTIWSGPLPSLGELAARSGISAVGNWGELEALCRTHRDVRYLPCYRDSQTFLLSQLLGVSPAQVEAHPSEILIRAVISLRSVKTDEEVAQIREAIGVSAEAYAVLLQHCKPGATEMELYGRMQGHVLARGGREAFPSIITRRGEVLHNHGRTGVLTEGDLLLADCGVLSPLGYASDITRTLPASGYFTTQQIDIYQIVADALEQGTRVMAPGVPFQECHMAAARVVATGLTELGLMRGDPGEAVAVGAHALFFPHGLGHMLGLDVHDMESLGEDRVGYDAKFRRSSQFGLSGLRMGRRLEPGFVLTVEPGVYFIPALIALWREQGRHAGFINYPALDDYLNFGGIRIEDDVLVTSHGTEVLSVGIPKSIQDLSRCMEWRV